MGNPFVNLGLLLLSTLFTIPLPKQNENYLFPSQNITQHHNISVFEETDWPPLRYCSQIFAAYLTSVPCDDIIVPAIVITETLSDNETNLNSNFTNGFAMKDNSATILSRIRASAKVVFSSRTISILFPSLSDLKEGVKEEKIVAVCSLCVLSFLACKLFRGFVAPYSQDFEKQEQATQEQLRETIKRRQEMRSNHQRQREEVLQDAQTRTKENISRLFTSLIKPEQDDLRILNEWVDTPD